jgi:hypothetical protein
MTSPDPAHEDPVPIFGSWPRIYLAVVVSTLAWIVFVAVFSRWPF